MKIRYDFVTNSSSSSFIISKSYLTDEQIHKIYCHISTARELAENGSYSGRCEYEDAWSIEEDDVTIKGHTCIDNFDFYEFLLAIGVPNYAVIWED